VFTKLRADVLDTGFTFLRCHFSSTIATRVNCE
jgi:hypothetical protein